MDVIEQIEQQISVKRAEIDALEKALMVLRGGGGQLAGLSSPGSKVYEGLGIVDATKRFLREVGAPRTTSEIKDALMARGWTTRSKNPTATIYATLDNSKQFDRTKDGHWSLKSDGNADSTTRTEH